MMILIIWVLYFSSTIVLMIFFLTYSHCFAYEFGDDSGTNDSDDYPYSFEMETLGNINVEEGN